MGREHLGRDEEKWYANEGLVLPENDTTSQLQGNKPQLNEAMHNQQSSREQYIIKP